MKPLSGLDATFLYLEAPETPMHVGSLHLYDPPPGRRIDFLARARRHIRSRLHLAPVFRRRLATLPLELASPMWVEDGRVDLDYHLRRMVLPRQGTRAALEACVARLHGELLDRRRPLWRFYLIEGLASGHLAWYSKVHHAALDGAAGVQLANALLDVTPQPRKVPAPRRRLEETPGIGTLVGAAFRNTTTQYVKLIRHLPDVARVLGGMIGKARGGSPGRDHLDIRRNVAFGPRTPLNVAITAERTFATASIPLDEVKAIAARNDAKVNDVVLALASGALRRYLADHGGVPRRPLVAAMPVSLRDPGDTEYSTRATMVLASLATHLRDPIARLDAIRDSTGAAKALTAHTRSVLPTDFPSLGAPWILAAAARLYGRAQQLEAFPPLANVVISNVPGPQTPLYLAGAKMLTYWPASIVEHGLGLNITVQSYCGSLDFGLIAARRAVPDIRRLVRGLRESLDELKSRSAVRRPRAGARKRAAGARL
ncbi:MAG TPA: wax ester/triacylglycerol synthase family O-acyltransferase [Burkholderiales bacterium]|nr:wax ester/triacylglycerol synthase family O-acyltransferase [Burkholderiales bacterium]